MGLGLSFAGTVVSRPLLEEVVRLKVLSGLPCASDAAFMDGRLPGADNGRLLAVSCMPVLASEAASLCASLSVLRLFCSDPMPDPSGLLMLTYDSAGAWVCA